MTPDERRLAARQKVERVFRDIAPGFNLSEGPLDQLVWWLKDAPYPGWQNMENAFPDARSRRERLAHATAALLIEIERTEASDTAALRAAIWALRQPLQEFSKWAHHEADNLPPADPRAWRVFAAIFYELAIQAWLEGGADYFRGTVPQFGIGETGKVTNVVKELLKIAGKNVTAAAIAKHLATQPAPGPWLSDNESEPVGRDFAAWENGEWDHNEKKRRVKLAPSEAFSKDVEIKPKKKKRAA